MIRIEYLPEPKLKFADSFQHEDAKTGLSHFGPFGKSVDGLHKSEVRVGFVGTGEGISLAQEWVSKCSSEVESQNVKTINVDAKAPEGSLFYNDKGAEDEDSLLRLDKILNADFIGFNPDSAFSSRFVENPRWVRRLESRELERTLQIENSRDRIYALAELIDAEILTLTTITPKPDVIIVVISSEMAKRAESAPMPGGFNLDLRRLLKAKAMIHRNPTPTQLIRQTTLEGKGSKIQEVATRAWNFCVAQYYKADGIPWVPSGLDPDTCYMGINFHKIADGEKLSLRSSVAQAFDYLGQGLVLRSDPFEWNPVKMGKSPHLKRIVAADLIEKVLIEYRRVKGYTPKRLVVHKKSNFWGSDRDEYNEVDGIYEGCDRVVPNLEIDLVSLGMGDIHLFRQGIYPPVRGTYFSIDGEAHSIYTTGFIPFLETYPGGYIPRPIEIAQHIGGSHKRDLCKEILNLTKMNLNNCAFADGIPITLSFASKVGEIMRFLPTGAVAQSGYKFYM